MNPDIRKEIPEWIDDKDEKEKTWNSGLGH